MWCGRAKKYPDNYFARFSILLIFVLLYGVSIKPAAVLGADTGYLPPQSQTANNEVKIYVSNGELFKLSAPAATMFVADPNVADIQIPARDRVFIFGKKPGRTTFFALGADGSKLESFDIKVTYNTADLTRFLRIEAGDLPVTLTEAPQGLILNGVVASPEVAERIRAVALRLAGEGNPVVNNLRISGAMQVSIKVRIAEISKSVVKELGVNWSAVANRGAFNFGLATGREFLAGAQAAANGAQGASTLITRSSTGAGAAFAGFSGKNGSITALIDALANEGLASILAEPTLTALSGEKASFLAGGEFPIPVVQGVNNTSTISVDFRKYGVGLDFTPTVLSERLISMNVKPEVSELSTEGAVSINGFSIPALTTRRTETTIQLGSGQSLVIAGLVQNRFTTEIDKFPGLGDLPVLGALFRSSRFRKNETELIIVVTPYVVRPLTNGAEVPLPNDNVQPPTDLERIIAGKLAKERTVNKPVQLKGDPGFMLR
jgi:pilus assembly protein CpaC